MDKDQEQEAARDTMVEPTVGGDGVDLWLKGWAEPRDRSTEAEPGCLEEHVKQTGRGPRATSTAQKPKAELLALRTKAETGTRLARATIEQARAMGKPEEGRSPAEPKG